jgi:acyl-CoA synthetase (NDP forming)
MQYTTKNSRKDLANALHRLLKPSSIAVVGASNTPKKPGYNLIQALTHFSGDVYPINPGTDQEIQGFKTYPNLSAVGKPIDLVIFSVPAKFVLEILENASDISIGGCMIVTSGFSEVGTEGEGLQERLKTLCTERGIRVIGPNTAGFMDPSRKLYASFVPELDSLDAGNVGVVSQSGAMNMVLSFLAKQAGLGVSLAIGLGNMMDVAHADLVSYLAEDDTTDVIIIYAEGISRGRDLYEAIKLAVPKKPVVVLMVGKADIAEFAASHTGNMIGSYSLKKSVLEQAGAIIVESEAEAIDAAIVFSKQRLAPNEAPGIGVITGQAGPGMIITDKLKDHNLSVPELTEKSIRHIGSLLPPLTYIKNPVDTGRPSATFDDILHTVCEDERIDAVVTFLLEEADAIDPVEVFKEAQKSTQSPMIFGTVGINAERIQRTTTTLLNQGIPAFPSPVRAANAAIMLGLDAKRQAALLRMPEKSAGADSFERVNANSPMDEAASKSFIASYGFSSPSRCVCKTRKATENAFRMLTAPVVVKVLDTSIQHKTEVGGVHINIRTRAELSDALDVIDRIEGDNSQRSYLVEEMAGPAIEMIMGATNNKCFGPVIMLGMGGTAAEAIGDIVTRAAPITRLEALEMIAQLRCSELLDGWRGEEPADKDSLADCLVNLGVLISRNFEISELDLNPVRVYPEGVLVLDALIQFHQK